MMKVENIGDTQTNDLSNLLQIYQVSYVNVEVGLSPRPGNWILEKSVDGSTFVPWQYFAMSDPDCWLNYGTPPMIGRPKHLRDNQVICTSHFSRIDPLQNGTVSLVWLAGLFWMMVMMHLKLEYFQYVNFFSFFFLVIARLFIG